jgi:hypothetical protein
MMSTEEVAKCADRLQYLYEVLYGIRRVTGGRFPDIEADLSTVLGWLIVSRESIAFEEVMRLCDKCANAVDSRMRECPDNLYGRGGLTAEIVGASG